MTIRKPIVANRFYSGDFGELDRSIKESFESDFGPGALPLSKRVEGKIVYGAVVPHAGYIFSGACAAWVYKTIAEAEFSDVYIILGTNHLSRKTCASSEDWKTPFGVVKCASDFVKKLEEKEIEVDNDAHQHEHSIEVQLPFLQFACRDKITMIKIVPIIIADSNYEKWGKIIKEIIEMNKKRKVTILASSDFTHYGVNYDYTPFDVSIAKEKMRELDRKAINFIENMDAKGFLKHCEETGATICGKYGIAVLLWLMKKIHGSENKGSEEKKGRLLNYYTSGDVTRDYENAVGYGGILF